MAFVISLYFVAHPAWPSTWISDRLLRRRCRVRLFATVILALAISDAALAQPGAPDLKIDRVTQDDGMPAQPVTSVYQDDEGFLWFATWSGLYRYDGYSFTPFRHETDQPSTISNDWVSASVGDAHGRFWVATHGGGLNLMDRHTRTFEHFRHDPEDPSTISSDQIATMRLLNDGHLWLATSNGVTRFNPDTRTATQLIPDPETEGSLVGSGVRSIFEDAEGRVWIGTGNPFVATGTGALNLFDPETASFQSFQIRPDEPASLDNHIQAVIQKDAQTLLVAPWSGGIFAFDIPTRRFSRFATPLLRDAGAADTKLVGLTPDPTARVLWVSTYGAGLQRLDLDTGDWSKYVFEADNPFTIPDHRVWGAWFDSTGELWIGTHGGLARTSPEGKLPTVSAPGLGPDEWVTDLLEAAHGALWLGTSKNALIDWDPGTGRGTRHPLPNRPCAGWTFPGVGIASAQAGHFWVVGPCGLFAFHPDGGAFESVGIQVSEQSLGSDQAIRLIEASDGSVWMASHPGAMRIDPRQRTYEIFAPEPADPDAARKRDVEDVAEDHMAQVWVATAAGLSRFDAANATWAQYPTGRIETSTAVTSILPADDGGLWITTDTDGLAYFREGEPRESVFGIREGLHSNTVMRVVRDQDGLFWVLSPTGLTAIDTETVSVRRFDALDGLMDVRFGQHAMEVLADGRIAIGGRGGLNLFDPRDYAPSSNPPNLVLDAVHARGQLVIRQQPRSITLSHDQNDLAIDYVGLGAANPNQIQYSYRLIGLDDAWVDVGSERSARYSNLAPGAYVFEVRGAAGSGPWSEIQSLAVTIDPPWWMTGWAFALYFAVVALGLVLAFRMQTRRVIRAERLQAAEREAEQAAILKKAYTDLERTHAELKATQVRLDELKSQFFANISHEFRTPLTLIIGQAEALLATAGDAERRKLEMLERNGQHLLRLINQLLDLSAMEFGGLELRPQDFDLIPFFRNVVGTFESPAHQRGIGLRFEADFETLPARFERDKLEKIFLNLVSNALKFTDDGEVVVALTTKAEADGRSVVVTVSDTGIGIPPDRLPFVFDRFYQVGSKTRRPHEGTGIGLALAKELATLHGGTIGVESEEGHGTVFTVTLPLTPATQDLDGMSSPLLEESETRVGFGASPYRHSAVEDPPAVSGDDANSAANPIVLVVEDNVDVRTYIVENLSSDYALLEAENGKSGLEKAFETTPDLIVTDVMMPGIDGFDLARQLRSDQRTSHIPVIMLTARAGEDDRIKGLDTGVDDYLVKPFSPRELRARVRNLIYLRKQLRERFSTATKISPSDVSAVSMDQEFVRQVLEAVDRHLDDERFSAELLADEIGMSVSQLNRKLRALVDQSAGKLIRSMRLQRAADLLMAGAGTVAEIAYQVGFGSHASFSTAFKSHFGVSPSEFGREPA